MIKINYVDHMKVYLPDDYHIRVSGYLELGDLVFDLDKKFDVQPINEEFLEEDRPPTLIEDWFYGVARKNGK